jgi:uncharacterized protein YlxW (UPF0749 family)
MISKLGEIMANVGVSSATDNLADLRAERNQLQAALDDCREQRDAADEADHEAIRRATADIEAALERADGQAIETAVQEIRDALARLEDDDTDD